MRFCIRLSSFFLSIFFLAVPVFAISTSTDVPAPPIVEEERETVDLSQVTLETAQLLDATKDILSTSQQILDGLNTLASDTDVPDVATDTDIATDTDFSEPVPPIVLYAPAPTVLNGNVFLDLPDEPPEDAPYYGQWYISGTANGQRVVIYTPNNDNGWGVDENGFLVRLGNSASGQLYLNGNIPNSVSMAAYSYPRYRTGTAGSTYIDLHIVPNASNINIYSAFPIKDNLLGFDVPDYVMFFTVGLIAVILLTKKR